MGCPDPVAAGTHEGVPHAGHRRRSIRNERSECQLNLTVLYDAECDFCRHTAHVLRTIDSGRRLRFVPLQTYAGPVAGMPPRADLLERLHVVDAGGTWSSGGSAMTRIAAEIPALAPLSFVGRLPIVSAFVDTAYRLVAARRPAISRWMRLDRCHFEPDAH